METENRSILILFSVVVLLVFLDHQSDRQIKLAGLENVDRLSAESLTESVEDEAKRLDRLHRPAVERQVKETVQEGVDDASEVIRRRTDETVETARRQAEQGLEESAEAATEKATRVVKRTLNQTLDKAKLQLKEVSLEGDLTTGDRSLPALPVLPSMNKEGQRQTRLVLYFPGFQGRSTVMMKVQRSMNGTVNPLQALDLLQKGPSPREKGLVNAFDSSMQVKGLYLSEGIAEVEVSNSVHRMSMPIRQDRLDQLCLTLFQFREIRGIRIIVDGVVVRQLGKGKDAIPLAQPIGRVDRKVEEYRSL